MKPTRLNTIEITEKLIELNDSVSTLWEIREEKLHAEIQFPNFVKAFSFMTAVALIAEKVNHHPDWRNIYNRVIFDINTHEVNGLSELDFKLAAEINALI